MSRDQQWLAINFVDATVLYRRHGNGLTAVKQFDLMSYPAFRSTANVSCSKIWWKREPGSETWHHELIEFRLDDLRETGISVKNARFGVYHQRGIVYEDENANAVKLFKLDGVETLYEGETPGKPAMMPVTDNYLFIGDIDQTIKVDLRDKSQTVLPEQVKGQITANDKYIYFRDQQPGSMVIFKGELSQKDDK